MLIVSEDGREGTLVSSHDGKVMSCHSSKSGPKASCICLSSCVHWGLSRDSCLPRCFTSGAGYVCAAGHQRPVPSYPECKPWSSFVCKRAAVVPSESRPCLVTRDLTVVSSGKLRH